jgi:hypothetical protein
MTDSCFKINDNLYTPRIFIDVCCNPHANGEHKLLESVFEKDPNGVVFDIGARNSEFPNFSKNHSLHLFDPKFIYEPGVDYSKCVINERALNSTDYKVDDYCLENNINEILFMKIDTDGYDVDVLMGAHSAIKNTRYIQIEHDMYYLLMKQDMNKLYELLDGFKIYKITRDGLISVDRIREDYIYSNYLFARDDIHVDPCNTDVEYFKKVFYEIPSESIESAYNNGTHPFYKQDVKINIENYLHRYYSQYMSFLVNNALSYPQ